MSIEIREASKSELDDVLSVERAAFDSNEEVDLVSALLDDSSAQPALSLLAWEGDRAVGHILFTAARLTETHNTASISLLAPLAVIPEAQKQGIGTQLIERGFQLLSQAGVELVFVLGHPTYYPRHGFKPAGRLGFETPHPILEEQATAWMVQALRPNLLGIVSGKVVCADALNQPEFWRE
ncbi:MAG: N-acetyltransferase [Cyanobacteria bacterium P01_A01_bin.123]